MNLLLKRCKIIDPSSAHHDTVQDVFISEGQIKTIGADLKVTADQVVDRAGMELYPGWLDIGVHSGDPGFEHRDDMASIAQAAAAGGFTGIVTFPNTQPTIQSKSEVMYIRQSAKPYLIDVYPAGALTRNCKGEEITEMIDMNRAGAVAFTDGLHPVSHTGVFLRALQYVKTFDGVVIHHAYDHQLAKEGQLHEGYTSTTLGMRGIPSLAEEIMIQRDLSLLAYAQSRLHLHCISTAAAVDLVREAKKKGLKVTASVAYLNLIFTDEDLVGFNSALKVLPPLRSKSDQEVLLAGLVDGTIDSICTNHVPLEDEKKKLEFSYADFGASGLQTLYSGLRTRLGDQISSAVLADKLAHGPREVLGIDPVSISEGASAQLTICLPDDHWSLERSNNQSKSQNNPFWKGIMKGKILGLVNGQQSMIFES